LKPCFGFQGRQEENIIVFRWLRILFVTAPSVSFLGGFLLSLRVLQTELSGAEFCNDDDKVMTATK
jgi:hypothetical protein